MRDFTFLGLKIDKKFFFVYILALFCSIMCGIVLCKTTNCNIYMREYANEYIHNAFLFNVAPLLFSHLFVDFFIFSIFFIFTRILNLKYFSLIFVFIRGCFFGLYCCILFSCSISGVVVCFFLYIPTTILSFLCALSVIEISENCDFEFYYLIPSAVSIVDTLAFLIFLNVIFRVACAVV